MRGLTAWLMYCERYRRRWFWFRMKWAPAWFQLTHRGVSSVTCLARSIKRWRRSRIRLSLWLQDCHWRSKARLRCDHDTMDRLVDAVPVDACLRGTNGDR